VSAERYMKGRMWEPLFANYQVESVLLQYSHQDEENKLRGIKMDLKNLIEINMLEYVATMTHTCTEMENNNEVFFRNWIDRVEYFKNNSENYGVYKIEGDHLGRSVPWALLKGEGRNTIVLIHHTDTVDIDDYGNFKKYAYNPYEITKKFIEENADMDEHSKKDLMSGEWLFGRGTADMKGGAAIHFAIFEHYSTIEHFNGNLLLIGLPDEENLSAGMRGAVPLIQALKVKHDLDYKLMLNSEPHERLDDKAATIYDGSVGKIMPIFYARGKLAHVGQVFRGLNPVNLLAEIVRRTELNPDYIETVGNTTTPPPAWLYMKDRKEIYDVSLPLAAGGYMNILTLDKSPSEIFAKLEELCTTAFKTVIDDMNKSYKVYMEAMKEEYTDLGWKPNVKKYGDLYKEAIAHSGAEFTAAIIELLKDIRAKLLENKISTAEGAFRIIEKTLEFTADNSPVVIIALAPPYYPNVHNSMIPEKYEEVKAVTQMVIDYAKKQWNQDYIVQSYYTGICDLSYGMFESNNEDIGYIEENMLMWNDVYYIPLDIIKEISMPVLNIGPWGKDFHKYTERVYIEDLFYRTPALVIEVIAAISG
jgi:arginine utilization protein RocB